MSDGAHDIPSSRSRAEEGEEAVYYFRTYQNASCVAAIVAVSAAEPRMRARTRACIANSQLARRQISIKQVNVAGGEGCHADA